jgi:UDP-glucose:(heptosyl)LPS alpha-1,3-glucosyltransferase
MKIAYLVHDYHRGGGHSRYVAELATRFAKEHEVHVFANQIDREGATGIRFHTVPAWRANALTTVLTFALPVTFQIGLGFDIIHSQGFCGFRGNVFTGHICNQAWHLARKKLEGGLTLRESTFNVIASALEHSVYRSVRHGRVVAISKRVADDIAHFYHCPAPIRVIHHGVDLERFSPENRMRWRCEVRREYGLQESDMVFLYVGDLRKGASLCIQALSRLEQGRLLFISRSRADSYRREADAAGLGQRVLFPGPTNRVERVYAAADALVLPTPYDAFAMVVTEAMASGLPVVVSREAGASELIRHNVNGLLLDDLASVPALAANMQALADGGRWAKALGEAARKTVEPISWDAVAKQTMRVYEDLLRNSN